MSAVCRREYLCVNGSMCWGGPREGSTGPQNHQTCAGMFFCAVLTQMVRAVCRPMMCDISQG